MHDWEYWGSSEDRDIEPWEGIDFRTEAKARMLRRGTDRVCWSHGNAYVDNLIAYKLVDGEAVLDWTPDPEPTEEDWEALAEFCGS